MGDKFTNKSAREPVSDIDTAAADSLTCLTRNGRLEKRTWCPGQRYLSRGGRRQPMGPGKQQLRSWAATASPHRCRRD